MTPQASTSKILNPFAPAYNPISHGVTPSPPPPFFFPPPPTACRPPPSSSHLQPPLPLPHEIHYHQPSTSLNPPQLNFYPTYSAYYVTYPNQFSITQPPQWPRPTPAVPVQPGRRSAPRGRVGERGRGSYSTERVSRIDNLNFERRVKNNRVGFPKHQRFSKQWTRIEGNRHKILPLKPDEDKTTVMIKNIPYACPRLEMISMLDDFCSLENQRACAEGISADEERPYAYDFLYLPIDFRTKNSRGFAFVNFTSSRAVWKFFDFFHLKKCDFVERYMNWTKRIEIVCAQIQGKENLVKHFSESVFECGSDEFLPVCFSPARDGSGQPVELTVVGNRRPAARWDSRRNHKA